MKSFLLFIVLVLSVTGSSQNIGFGTTSPVARLDVTGAGPNGITNTFILKNSLGDTLLRMRDDGRMTIGYNGNTAGRTISIRGGVNFFNTDEIFGGSISPTDTSLIIASISSEDKYVIIQPSGGRVGIGTLSPQAKLHVNGGFMVGPQGTALTKIIKKEVGKNLNTIQPNSTLIETFTVFGAIVGSTVHISPDQPLPDGLVIAYARVAFNNTIEVKFTNTTALALNPVAMNYHITVIE
jgi:hypothetical protein